VGGSGTSDSSVRIFDEDQLELIGCAGRYIASATGARELGVLKVPDGHSENTRIQALKNRGGDVERHVSSSACRCDDLP